jgi:hypothetical protein
MDLANNPLFDTIDELGSRNFGSLRVHEPSIGQTLR